jgi:AhpD family alkylhydroperoxidase
MFDEESNIKTLSRRERELTAIGAAIASNCVPCIEYHIPQARRVGLSDSQILEAVELADEVRKVPADKVIQTACALLELNNSSESHNRSDACGCSDEKPNSDVSGREAPAAEHVRLDNRDSKDDNEARSESRSDDADDCCS